MSSFFDEHLVPPLLSDFDTGVGLSSPNKISEMTSFGWTFSGIDSLKLAFFIIGFGTILTNFSLFLCDV